MDKQDNQRDIDAILRDCSINYIEQISPIYQGNPIRVHIEGTKMFFKQYDDRGNFEETPPEKIIVIIDKDFDHDKNAYPPENYHPLTTETQKQEVIALLKKNRAIHEGKQLTQQKAYEELRAFCRNLPLVLPTDTSCDFTVNDLRQYLCERDGVEQSYISNSNKIDFAIEALIQNRNFLIEGQNDREKRERIAYKEYRMTSANTYIFFSRHEIDSGNLRIFGARNPQDGTKKHWEWQNITFNKAQMKQVFPLGGEQTIPLKKLKKATEEQVLKAAERVGNGRLAVNDTRRKEVQADLERDGLKITTTDYRKIIRKELKKNPEKQSPEGRPSKQETEQKNYTELCG
jgi:hypothetical protein